MVRRRLLLLAVLLVLATLSWGVAPLTLTLAISDVDHPAVVASGIRLVLDDDREKRSLRLSIASLALPPFDIVLGTVTVDCPASSVPLPRLRCTGATAEVADTPWGRQRVKLDIDWQDTAHWSLRFRGLRHPAGRLQGRVRMGREGWRLELQGPALVAERLPQLRGRLRALGIVSLSGRLSLDVEARGQGGEPRYLAVTARGRGLSWSDAAGTQAAEKVELRLSAAAGRRGSVWAGAVNLSASGGELYSDPIFLDLAAQPLHLVADGSWRPGRVQLKKLILDGGQALQVQGSGGLTLEPPAPADLELRLDSADLASLFATWVQPWLLESALGEVEVKGRGGVHLRWRDGRLAALDLALTEAGGEQVAGRFGIEGLTGDLHWVAEGEAPDSHLRFGQAHVGPLDFGEGRLVLNSAGRYAYLVRPLEIPFYEGQLVVPEATWLQTDAGGEGGFGLRLQALSLGALTTDLGWPRMEGRVNARIPRARYRNGELRAAGDIVVEAFDGRAVLSDLRLSELGSAAPVLTANLRLRRLDLLQLTRTFSFGEIQGRLDGEIENLRLVAWEPDRFDARLYSSPNDDRRHRISQRAVDNLTALGNGVSGALSSSFLRLFENFSYDRIELKIRQRGDRAWIDGIPAPDGGYYLVKGAGIPRIDVIGRNREVAWEDLLARLRNIRVEGMQMR
ncbi:MAG: hypothetical protein D6720_04445 [Gammaproteobacteria bacterium]|nr:MAG: hypothetical protein D6720_04445 [Gammaproteobacteria bacterium]